MSKTDVKINQDKEAVASPLAERKTPSVNLEEIRRENLEKLENTEIFRPTKETRTQVLVSASARLQQINNDRDNAGMAEVSFKAEEDRRKKREWIYSLLARLKAKVSPQAMTELAEFIKNKYANSPENIAALTSNLKDLDNMLEGKYSSTLHNGNLSSYEISPEELLDEFQKITKDFDKRVSIKNFLSEFEERPVVAISKLKKNNAQEVEQFKKLFQEARGLSLASYINNNLEVNSDIPIQTETGLKTFTELTREICLKLLNNEALSGKEEETYLSIKCTVFAKNYSKEVVEGNFVESSPEIQNLINQRENWLRDIASLLGQTVATMCRKNIEQTQKLIIQQSAINSYHQKSQEIGRLRTPLVLKPEKEKERLRELESVINKREELKSIIAEKYPASLKALSEVEQNAENIGMDEYKRAEIAADQIWRGTDGRMFWGADEELVLSSLENKSPEELKLIRKIIDQKHDVNLREVLKRRLKEKDLLAALNLLDGRQTKEEVSLDIKDYASLIAKQVQQSNIPEAELGKLIEQIVVNPLTLEVDFQKRKELLFELNKILSPTGDSFLKFLKDRYSGKGSAYEWMNTLLNDNSKDAYIKASVYKLDYATAGAQTNESLIRETFSISQSILRVEDSKVRNDLLAKHKNFRESVEKVFNDTFRDEKIGFFTRKDKTLDNVLSNDLNLTELTSIRELKKSGFLNSLYQIRECFGSSWDTTDEERIKTILANMSFEQIEALKSDYKTTFKKTLDSDINAEITEDSKHWVDISLLLNGNPHSYSPSVESVNKIAEMIKLRHRYDRRGLDFLTDIRMNTGKELDEINRLAGDLSNKFTQDGKVTREEYQQLLGLYDRAFLTADSFRIEKEAFKETCKDIGTGVVAIGGAIAITGATGGTFWLVVGATGGAILVQRSATGVMFDWTNYGGAEFATDAALAGLEAITLPIGAGFGEKAIAPMAKKAFQKAAEEGLEITMFEGAEKAVRKVAAKEIRERLLKEGLDQVTKESLERQVLEIGESLLSQSLKTRVVSSSVRAGIDGSVSAGMVGAGKTAMYETTWENGVPEGIKKIGEVSSQYAISGFTGGLVLGGALGMFKPKPLILGRELSKSECEKLTSKKGLKVRSRIRSYRASMTANAVEELIAEKGFVCVSDVINASQKLKPAGLISKLRTRLAVMLPGNVWSPEQIDNFLALYKEGKLSKFDIDSLYGKNNSITIRKGFGGEDFEEALINPSNPTKPSIDRGSSNSNQPFAGLDPDFDGPLYTKERKLTKLGEEQLGSRSKSVNLEVDPQKPKIDTESLERVERLVDPLSANLKSARNVEENPGSGGGVFDRVSEGGGESYQPQIEGRTDTEKVKSLTSGSKNISEELDELDVHLEVARDVDGGRSELVNGSISEEADEFDYAIDVARRVESEEGEYVSLAERQSRYYDYEPEPEVPNIVKEKTTATDSTDVNQAIEIESEVPQSGGSSETSEISEINKTSQPVRKYTNESAETETNFEPQLELKPSSEKITGTALMDSPRDIGIESKNDLGFKPPSETFEPLSENLRSDFDYHSSSEVEQVVPRREKTQDGILKRKQKSISQLEKEADGRIRGFYKQKATDFIDSKAKEYIKDKAAKSIRGKATIMPELERVNETLIPKAKEVEFGRVKPKLKPRLKPLLDVQEAKILESSIASNILTRQANLEQLYNLRREELLSRQELLNYFVHENTKTKQEQKVKNAKRTRNDYYDTFHSSMIKEEEKKKKRKEEKLRLKELAISPYVIDPFKIIADEGANWEWKEIDDVMVLVWKGA